MAKKWNDYTRREKTIGILGAVFGVFVIGSIANGVSGPSSTTNTSAPSASQQVQAEPVTTYDELVETETVAFEKTVTESSLYDKGTSQVTTQGVDGVKISTYKVTLIDGVETKRELIKEEVTTAPVTEVTSIGTYVKPATPKAQASSACDANYSGACVPIASDVDCAGGSGNGPAYVSGPVNVVGLDIYDLDRDGNGLGCE